MDGSRDTELAIGAFQQGHTLQGAGPSTKLPRGQVAGFRTSLWKEHTGVGGGGCLGWRGLGPGIRNVQEWQHSHEMLFLIVRRRRSTFVWQVCLEHAEV